MSRTPWSRAGSSLTSDRIPSRLSQHPQSTNNSAHRGTVATGPPKSKEVRRLEKLRDDMEITNGQAQRDPTGGCFCQARVHSLSIYTPLCESCGLVVCSLHQPHFVCPSCYNSLLTVNERNGLVEELNKRIDETLRKEEEERLRLEKEQRAKVGEFPSLPGAPQSSVPPPTNTGSFSYAQHKVLTVSSGKNKGKKSTVTISYSAPLTTVQPSSSRTSSDSGDNILEGVRVPRPPVDVPVYNVDPNRSWANVRAMAGGGSGPVYVGDGRSGK